MDQFKVSLAKHIARYGFWSQTNMRVFEKSLTPATTKIPLDVALFAMDISFSFAFIDGEDILSIVEAVTRGGEPIKEEIIKLRGNIAKLRTLGLIANVYCETGDVSCFSFHALVDLASHIRFTLPSRHTDDYEIKLVHDDGKVLTVVLPLLKKADEKFRSVQAREAILILIGDTHSFHQFYTREQWEVLLEIIQRLLTILNEPKSPPISKLLDIAKMIKLETSPHHITLFAEMFVFGERTMDRKLLSYRWIHRGLSSTQLEKMINELINHGDRDDKRGYILFYLAKFLKEMINDFNDYFANALY